MNPVKTIAGEDVGFESARPVGESLICRAAKSCARCIFGALLLAGYLALSFFETVILRRPANDQMGDEL